MTNCNRCNQEIKWPENFEPGNRPLNLDSSLHKCSKKETPNTTSHTTTSTISQSIIDECEAFRVKFGPIESDARFDALARIYISRMMKR